jgi:hypothetical protein
MGIAGLLLLVSAGAATAEVTVNVTPDAAENIHVYTVAFSSLPSEPFKAIKFPANAGVSIGSVTAGWSCTQADWTIPPGKSVICTTNLSAQTSLSFQLTRNPTAGLIKDVPPEAYQNQSVSGPSATLTGPLAVGGEDIPTTIDSGPDLGKWGLAGLVGLLAVAIALFLWPRASGRVAP